MHYIRFADPEMVPDCKRKLYLTVSLVAQRQDGQARHVINLQGSPNRFSITQQHSPRTQGVGPPVRYGMSVGLQDMIVRHGQFPTSDKITSDPREFWTRAYPESGRRKTVSNNGFRLQRVRFLLYDGSAA